MKHATLRLALPLTLLLAACAPKSSHAPAVIKPPAIGTRAPDFTLPDAHGGDLTLSHITKTRPTLLIFYLGYSCPRCVSHLRELAARKPEFDKLRAQILTIGPDAVQDSKDSIDSFGDFPFPMLCDPEMKVARAYGLVDNPDILFHAAFIVDTHGLVRFAVKSSHPYDDVDALLKNLQEIDKEQ